jgi:hypothetical protein
MTAAVLTKPRYTGSITFGPGYPIPKMDRAVINLRGSANRAQVTILDFEGVKPSERGNQYDVLKDCKIEQDNPDELVITGLSARMIHEMKLRPVDATISFTLKLNGRCADCGYA